MSKSKSKSKKTLFNVGQCKQYNISSLEMSARIQQELYISPQQNKALQNRVHISFQKANVILTKFSWLHQMSVSVFCGIYYLVSVVLSANGLFLLWKLTQV